MGGGESNTLSFKKEDWAKVHSTKNYDVVERRDPHVQAQQYSFIPPLERTLEDEKKTYEWRQNKSECTVRVLGANLEKSGFGCCSSKTMANVITERVPVLLEQVGTLNERDEKIVLYNAIKGFAEASQYGIPYVNDKMIGFNNNGSVKVWLNEKFGTNELNEKEGPSAYSRTQNGLIKNITDLVKTKAANYPNREGFYNKLNQSNSFDEALNFITKFQQSVSYSKLEENITSISPSRLSSVNEIPKLNSSVPPMYKSSPPLIEAYKQSPKNPRISISYENPIN